MIAPVSERLHALELRRNVRGSTSSIYFKLDNIFSVNSFRFALAGSSLAGGEGRRRPDGKEAAAAAPVFQQLVKIGHQGYCNLEYEIHDTEPMSGMQRSLSYMRGVLAGLGYAESKA